MIKICRGSYEHRFYLMPTIEIETVIDLQYISLTFLKWYFGFVIQKKEK